MSHNRRYLKIRFDRWKTYCQSDRRWSGTGCKDAGVTSPKVCFDYYEVTVGGEEKPDCEHKNTEVRNQTDATCTEAGYTGDTVCKDCEVIVKAGTVIEAKGHDAETRNAKEATCTKDGYTGDEVCKVCDTVVEKELK